MQYTNNFSLRKPQLLEPASVADLNANADSIDTLLYQNRHISATDYNQNASYTVGDLVIYENLFYKCTGATSGNWDSTKWTRTTLAAEVENASQSGGSDVEGNPSGTATTQLEKLRIDNGIFFINDASKVIADEYDSTATYAIGEYCIHNTLLYKCTTAVSTAEAFDSNKWTACLVTDEMGQGGDNANQNIADEYSTSSTYAVGDYAIYQGLLYKCTTAVSTAGAWDSAKWAQCVVTDEMGGGGTVSDMTGATSSTPGTHGLVPAPAAGDNTKFLCGDGTWQTAGGGGGCFIDTSNVIKALTEFKPSMSYQATNDCFVVIYIIAGNNTKINIDGATVGNFDGSGSFGLTNSFYVKAGQTISVERSSSSYNNYYIVYGVMEGNGGGHTYSTTEQDTGDIWIDGKHIYEKTYSNLSITVNTSDSWVEIGSIGDIDTLLPGFCIDDSRQSFACNLCTMSSRTKIGFHVNDIGSQRVITTIVIRYTKVS